MLPDQAIEGGVLEASTVDSTAATRAMRLSSRSLAAGIEREEGPPVQGGGAHAAARTAPRSAPGKASSCSARSWSTSLPPGTSTSA